MKYYDLCNKSELHVHHDYVRSSLDAAYYSQIHRSRVSEWQIPTRIRSLPPGANYKIKIKVSRWPDYLTSMPLYGLLVSKKISGILSEYPRTDVQMFPVEVRGGRGSVDPPEYNLINVSRMIDAANLSAMKATHVVGMPPDMARLHVDHPRTPRGPVWVIDPERVPRNVHIFTLKYCCGIFVSDNIAKLLSRAKIDSLAMGRVRLSREDNTRRESLLSMLRAEARPSRSRRVVTKVATVGELQVTLKVRLPKRVEEYFEETEAAVYSDQEVYSLSEATEATRVLRDWKELVWGHDLVVVADDGRGGYFAIDVSKTKQGDCPVVYFDHELADIDKKTGEIRPRLEPAARTFSGWIRRLKRGGSPLPEL